MTWSFSDFFRHLAVKLHWQVQGTILQKVLSLHFYQQGSPEPRLVLFYYYCPLCSINGSQTQNFFPTWLLMNLFSFSIPSLFFCPEGFRLLGNSHTVVWGVSSNFKMLHTLQLLGWKSLHPPCCPYFVYVKWNCLVYRCSWLFKTVLTLTKSWRCFCTKLPFPLTFLE